MTNDSTERQPNPNDVPQTQEVRAYKWCQNGSDGNVLLTQVCGIRDDWHDAKVDDHPFTEAPAVETMTIERPTNDIMGAFKRLRYELRKISYGVGDSASFIENYGLDKYLNQLQSNITEAPSAPAGDTVTIPPDMKELILEITRCGEPDEDKTVHIYDSGPYCHCDAEASDVIRKLAKMVSDENGEGIDAPHCTVCGGSGKFTNGDDCYFCNR